MLFKGCVAAYFALAHLFLFPALASLQAEPEFRLGFQDLAALIPQVVGEPVEDEHHSQANGDALQRTTKGLMVWRKADNWTAFTDGTTTWINGPLGLQHRSNGERFEWEIEVAALQSPTPDEARTPSRGPALNAVPSPTSKGVRSPEPAGEWVTSVASNTKYYTSRDSAYWKGWSPRNLIWFATEGDLLSAYPGRVRK